MSIGSALACRGPSAAAAALGASDSECVQLGRRSIRAILSTTAGTSSKLAGRTPGEKCGANGCGCRPAGSDGQRLGLLLRGPAVRPRDGVVSLIDRGGRP